MRHRAVVVGTSPSMLIQALRLAETGDEVTIVDRAPVIGGAWSAPPLLGLTSVECGVHLLENRPQFYAALERLGIELEEDDRCTTLWRGRPLAMAPARVLLHAMVAANALRRGKFDSFRRTAVSAVRSAFQLRTPFRYPSTGCRAIHDTLTRNLAAYGIVPMLNTQINSIDVDDGVRCSTSGGPILADRIVLGSRAHAPLIINKREMHPPLERNRTATLIILGEDARRIPFTYVELLRHPHLKRVRDVTPFCLPRSGADAFVLAVQLRASGERLLASTGPEVIIDILVGFGLLSDAALLSYSTVCEYACETITDAGLRIIERRARGRVVTVRTTDFADGFCLAASPHPDGGASRA